MTATPEVIKSHLNILWALFNYFVWNAYASGKQWEVPVPFDVPFVDDMKLHLR